MTAFKAIQSAVKQGGSNNMRAPLNKPWFPVLSSMSSLNVIVTHFLQATGAL